MTEKWMASHFSSRPTRACTASAGAVPAFATCPSSFSSFNPERGAPLLCAVFSVHKRDASRAVHGTHG